MQLLYLIVDDEEFSRLVIENEAGKFPFLQKKAVCSNAIEALELVTSLRPDVLFADIEMPDVNGVELIRHLRGSVPVTVFITSHPEFALESYDLDVFDYLLKPVDAQRFERCALRIRDFFDLREKAFLFEEKQEAGSIIIKQGYEKHKLYIADILYIEAMGDYTRIITGAGKYLVLESVGHMLQKLPDGKFVRIHRSYAVNRDRIRSVKGSKLYLSEYELPVGKLYKNIVKDVI